jgi:protein-S-isoprenylcysteine O-methyltransferase Ste14
VPDNKAYSLLLVAAQFALIIIICSRALPATLSLASLPALVLILLGGVLAISAVISLRLANLSAMPEPVKQGTLISSGAYRYIRHPMYTAVLLVCWGLVFITPNLLSVGLCGLLVIVLILKIKREEALLLVAYPDYSQYRQSTGALIPPLLK